MLWGLAAVTLAAIYVWSRWIEPRWFHISRHQIHIDKTLHRPLRILHLSDIHFAEHNPSLFRFFDKLSQEEADLIFITGDIIDLDEGIDRAVYNFKKLKATYGIFAVLGNHDYYRYEIHDTFSGNFLGKEEHPSTKNDASRLVKEMKKIGIQVLINESAAVEYHGRSLKIHGLDDPVTGKPDLNAIRSAINSEELNLLLTHSLDVLKKFPEGEIDFSFSGHTHGGQICFPWIGAIFKHTRLGKEYVSGFKPFKKTHCSISRGIHMGRSIRHRLLCPPEAILLEVRNSHHA